MTKELDAIKKSKIPKNYLIIKNDLEFLNFLGINNVSKSNRAQENAINCGS